MTNTAEWKAGTRADLADTDGDGVSDRDEIEITETNALTADAAPFQSVAVIPGSAFTASSGQWTAGNGKAVQECARGWLEYPVSLSAAGVYQLDLTFTPAGGGAPSSAYEIVFSVDGTTIRRETVTTADIATGHAKVLTPWLTAGNHTVRVFLDNSYWFRRVTMDQLEVLSAQGADANGNATPDWVESRVARFNSIEAPSTSITSPVCLEGKAKWSALSTLNGGPVQTAPDDRWFANLPLSDTAPTSISASLENGAITTTREISWIPVNLLETQTLTIRQGDALKLTAFTGSITTPEESVSLSVEGESATFPADQFLVHAFTTPGEIPVQVSHTLAGNVTTRSITVRVLGPPAMESPVCVLGFYRTVNFPALPAGVSLQLDPRIEVRENAAISGGGTQSTLRLTTMDDRSAVFRAGGATGPILSTVPFRIMRVRDADETAVTLAGKIASNQYKITMPVVVDGNYPGTSVIYDIFVGGVTFDDGTLQRTLLPGSSPAFGWDMTLLFYKAGLSGSNCHRASVWQGTRRIAFRQ